MERCGSSRAVKGLAPRLGRWAFLGVFIFTLALFASCGDDEYAGGPIGDPNPNDPHPVWVFAVDRWAKYDQNGNNILKFNNESRAWVVGLNPGNGDIWAAGSGGVSIYNSSAALKRNARLDGRAVDAAFDTKDKKVWVLHEPQIYDYWLAKFTYDGELIFDKPLGTAFANTSGMDVYEAAGNVWVITRGGNQGGYVYKMNKLGDIMFSKSGQELGFKFAFTGLCVDQTDGGVWIRGHNGGRPAPFLIKLSKNGKPVQKLYGEEIGLSDVGRRTGDVLIRTRVGDLSYRRLYDRSGKLLWQSEGIKAYSWSRIGDVDGSCWCTYWPGPEGYEMCKINRAGEYLLRDIPVLPVKHSFSLFVKNDPYLYN